MNTKTILFTSTFLISALTSSFSYANNDREGVVYGDDNRVDVYQSKNSIYKKLAASTAAMIPSRNLESSGDSYLVKGGTLSGDGICSDEKFAKQQTAAMCTGFLVGPDLLLTAGHCVKSMSDCESNAWVFDYSNTVHERAEFKINQKDIYTCTQIISRALDRETQNDYALVKLDRVTDRAPLEYRKSGQISKAAKILVIGHPSGLPTKIADGAYVRSIDNNYFFQANLDTFGGNSGSPVFNAKTGFVEGILVRGETDYVLDTARDCYRPKVCTMKDCRGEDVTRITNIEELK